MTISITAVESLDSHTTTHASGVGDLTYNAGDYLLCLLYTRDTSTASPTVSAGAWNTELSSIVSPFTSPYRFVFGFERPSATQDSDDALSWVWSQDVEATSVVVGVHQTGMTSGGTFFDSDVNTGSTTITVGSSASAVVILWVVSEAGTSVPGADLVLRSSGSGMPSGHGYVEAWAFQGAGPHSAAITAVSGNITYIYWVELISSFGPCLCELIHFSSADTDTPPAYLDDIWFQDPYRTVLRDTVYAPGPDYTTEIVGWDAFDPVASRTIYPIPLTDDAERAFVHLAADDTEVWVLVEDGSYDPPLHAVVGLHSGYVRSPFQVWPGNYPDSFVASIDGCIYSADGAGNLLTPADALWRVTPSGVVEVVATIDTTAFPFNDEQVVPTLDGAIWLVTQRLSGSGSPGGVDRKLRRYVPSSGSYTEYNIGTYAEAPTGGKFTGGLWPTAGRTDSVTWYDGGNHWISIDPAGAQTRVGPCPVPTTFHGPSEPIGPDEEYLYFSESGSSQFAFWNLAQEHVFAIIDDGAETVDYPGWMGLYDLSGSCAQTPVTVPIFSVS